MPLVIRTVTLLFLAGALVLANFGRVDALPTPDGEFLSNIEVIAEIAEEAASEEGLVTIPTATTTRVSLFHRRQMALRDFIRSRTPTTKAPVRIRPLLFPVGRNANGSTVYLLDSFNRQNKEETVYQIRPDILTKPTEISPELKAKFPIMSNRNPLNNNYEFNRVPAAASSPADKYEKYSFQDLMRILKGNDTAAGEQLRTANVSLDGVFGYSGENDFSLEPIGKAPKSIAWEPLKEAVLQFLQAPASGKLSFDANSTESLELPGEISAESDEFFEPNKDNSTTVVEELEATSAELTTDSGIKESNSTTAGEELKISSAESTTDSRGKESTDSTKVEEKIKNSSESTKGSGKKESTTEISLDSILNLNFWELLKDTPLALMPTASTAAVEVSTEPVVA